MGEWKALKQASGSGWKELERESGTGWKALEWESGYEDFTTFTEVDVGANRIQKTANHVDHYAYRNEDTYLYKYYGVNHFSDFTHKIKVREVSRNISAIGFVWGVSNQLNDVKGLKSGSYHSVFVGFYETAGLKIVVWETYGGSNYYTSDWWTAPQLNTWYYVKIVKSGTSLNAYIYSDSGYTNLLDTISRTLHASLYTKYLFACNTYNSGDVKWAINDIENFDIGE